MTVFHQDLFRSLVLYFAVLAAWGLFLWFRNQGPNGSYYGAMLIGEGIIIVQALSGLLLVATGHHPSDGLHWLYGGVVLLTLPVVHLVWAQKAGGSRNASVLYAAGCAFVLIVALVRSQSTG